MTLTASLSLTANLVLVRLLTAGTRPLAPSKVRADLGRLFAHPPTAQQWQQQFDELVSAGLVTLKPLRLTDAGRSQALEFLGVDHLPPRTNWGTLQVRYLVPKALGIPASATSTRQRVAQGDALATYLLWAHFDLPSGTGTSLGAVVEAIVCKDLGFPEETTLKGLQLRVLQRLLGADGPLDLEVARKRLPFKIAGATRADPKSLRQAILRNWSTEPDHGSAAGERKLAEPVASPAEFDLPAFAATVEAVARTCPSGRFGDSKVFIGHVWRAARQEPGFPPLDLDTFKQRLVEANRAGLLRLSRADLAETMDPADVRESETHYLNAIFHFIQLGAQQP